MSASETDPGAPRGDHGHLLAALAMAIAISLGGWFIATRSTLFDRDEPRFAEASVEMVHSGNWLYPTFDGELRPDKPILVYWLMATTVRLFGASEWSVRCWAPLSLAGAAFLTFLVGRRYFGARAGLLSMGMLGVAPLALMEGTIATTDALLLVCITAATASLAFSIVDGPKLVHFVSLAIALAAALLTKGPVGLAVPALSIVTAMWLARGRAQLGSRYAGAAALAACAGLALALCWAIPADAATGGEFARRGLGHHVVERMTSPLESHGGNYFLWLPFYLPIVIVGGLPCAAYLPAAISAGLGGRLGGAHGRALLCAWIVPCFVLMSLVSTKLVHYVLPIWPGLALASAAVVVAAERGAIDERDGRWLARGAWFLGIPALLLVAALALAPSFVSIEGLRAPATVLALLLAATATLGIRFHVRRRWRAGAVTFVAGGAITWLAGIALVMPVVERTKVAPAIAAAIRARTSGDIPVARYRFVEPSLDFYLDRPPIRELADEGQLCAWAAEDTPAVLVIPRSELEPMRGALGGARFAEIGSKTGWNVSKGRPLELVALGRNLPAPATR